MDQYEYDEIFSSNSSFIPSLSSNPSLNSGSGNDVKSSNHCTMIVLVVVLLVALVIMMGFAIQKWISATTNAVKVNNTTDDRHDNQNELVQLTAKPYDAFDYARDRISADNPLHVYIVSKKDTTGTRRLLRKGQTVRVNYEGYLVNDYNKPFDKGQNFAFRLGAGRVIPAWDLGLSENDVAVGDTLWLTLDSSLGYGSRGAGNVIPPNAKLVFYITVVDASSST